MRNNKAKNNKKTLKMPELQNNISSYTKDDNVNFATTLSASSVIVPPIKVKDKKLQKKIDKILNGAVIYIRVSSDEQVKGFSLDGQQDECKRFAERNGYKVLKIFREEGQSAKTTKRDKFQEMMTFCKENKKQVKYIIVYRIDRFTRNMLDLLLEEKALEKIGIEILTATETNESGYMGKFSRHFNGLIAQLDNDRRADATKNGMKRGFLEGSWMWKGPFGYYNDKNIKKIVPHPMYGKIVAKIFKKFATGCYSQAEILSDLKKEGIILRPNHLCDLLRNPIYCGYMFKPEWYPEPIKGNFEALVSVKTFNTVQDILNGRKPSIAQHELDNDNYPLKKILTCPYCGKKLTGSNSHSQRGKHLYQYYYCYNKQCPSKNKEIRQSGFSIRNDIAEEHFKNILSVIAPTSDVVELFKDIVKDVYVEQTRNTKVINDKLQKELDDLQECKKALVRKYAADKIKEDEYNIALEDFKNREQLIKCNLQIVIITPKEFNDFLEKSLTIIQNIANAWCDSNLSLKNKIQNLIFSNGLSADFKNFQNSLNSIIFKQIGSIKEPYIDKLPPSEFESLSTP